MSDTLHTQERILITGGTGFVGTHLVRYLQKIGETQVHVTAYSSDATPVSKMLPPEQIHEIDLTDVAATETLFKELQPTQVYHLAAIATVSNSFQQAELVLVNNTKLQLIVLNALLKNCPAARVLAVSSAEVYGQVPADQLPITEEQPFRPMNPYAVSKAAQDLLAQSYWLSQKLPIVRARPFNHIGEGQVASFVVPAFAKQIVAIERGEQAVIRVGNLDTIRDFSDVLDVVEAYHVLLTQGTVGEVYNVASGTGTSIQDILNLLIARSRAEIIVESDPERMRVSDTPMTIGDATKIRNLGWKPQHELPETIERILNYWRKQS